MLHPPLAKGEGVATCLNKSQLTRQVATRMQYTILDVDADRGFKRNSSEGASESSDAKKLKSSQLQQTKPI